MNTLFINTPVAFNVKQNLEPPLGIAYIAAVLRKNGHNVKIVDFEVEKYSQEILTRILNNFRPRLIGISCRTASYNSAKQLVGLIKKIDTNIFVVLGGHHVTAFPEGSILDTGCDAVVRGEGEMTMKEMVAALSKNSDLNSIKGLSYRDNSAIHHNHSRELIQNLDILPFPARDLLPITKYAVNSIITSRGCPFSCIYCDKSISTQNVRCRSSKNVYEEISSLHRAWSDKLIYFVDDFFFLNRRRISELFDLLKNNKHKIYWHCQSRVSSLDLALLPRAKECGCKLIIFGIETGDPKELEFIEKGHILKDVEKTVKATKDAGIEVRANFMLGFPISTHETIRNTIRFAAKLPLNVCRFFVVVPFPNTKLWDYVIKHNLIDYKNIDWATFDMYSTSYKVPGISQYELHCYAGAAYLHILKYSIIKETLLHGFGNITKLFMLIIKTKRIRGNISRTFPALANFIIELHFHTKRDKFLNKLGYLLKIVVLEKGLNSNRPVNKTLNKKNETFIHII